MDEPPPQPTASGSSLPPPPIQVFSSPTESTLPPIESLPDSFFAPTPSDLQQTQSTLIKKSKALNERGFVLQKTRDEERERKGREKVGRWPETTIRIKFSDRTQIQSTFPSTSRIGAVYDFVRGALNEEARGKPFTLYQPPATAYPEHPPPPPKTKVINPRLAPPPKPIPKTLADFELVPQSLLMVRWDDDEMNASNLQAPLLPSLLTEIKPLPPPQPKNVEPEPEEEEGKAEGKGKEKEEVKKEKKIPAWMMKGLKKK